MVTLSRSFLYLGFIMFKVVNSQKRPLTACTIGSFLQTSRIERVTSRFTLIELVSSLVILADLLHFSEYGSLPGKVKLLSVVLEH